MFSIRLASALVAATSLLPMAAAAGGSSQSILLIPSPTATLPASAMSTIGCFATGLPLDDHGPGPFTSPGSCQQICLGLDKDVLGLSDGERCWCGDEFPPEDSKTTNETCSTGCAGTKEFWCGGRKALWVMTTGRSRTLPLYHKDDPKSSSALPSTTQAAPQSSKSASTPVTTPTSAPPPPPKSGPSTAGIAAGVVVGVVGLAAIIAGIFFFLRYKKRREVEDQYRNRASVNHFVSGGKLHTSNSSMTDSRLDPDFMARRQSNGSIADNEDYSRRILKVTNA